MFKKILIANRGEIAVRVIRACRELGITPAVVFSEADRKSLAVRLADEAYPIGPPPVKESYLSMEKIIRTAQKCGAQAVHPGYGLLSENAGFAQQVEEAGLVFIGPRADALLKLGDKVRARRLAQSCGIPIVPGVELAPNVSEAEALAEAEKLGFPLLIKAQAGGGGKGMRKVEKKADFASALKLASSEALSYFGNGAVYLEKYLSRPRHVEIQILADAFGNCIHLGERECSIQRRHQKLLEESPSVAIDAPLRQKLGEAAVALTQKATYLNAGTVEFLVDENKNFYFLEMNARLQVEHPVTEMVTGLDLVALQIKIAAGEKLPLTQEDVRWSGHAIECRINAEEPAENFFPSSGKIDVYREPAGPGVRVDSGVYQGWEVGLFYDSLLAKLICWGPDRASAINRMRRALEEFRIFGIATNIPFHESLLTHRRFNEGDFSTFFLEEEKQLPDLRESGLEAALIGAVLFKEMKKQIAAPAIPAGRANSVWKEEARRAALRQW
ncbi:MAG: acetyl-CoA carboxylase biotin carboxylase subunit [candidate division Zixibacteria bacterium]|nr:acetyl-CoA carboxylase biotin carboxylase subunit [candidate division Zixibacteria bacterium]